MKKTRTAETGPVAEKKEAMRDWENEGGQIPKVSKTQNEASPEAVAKGLKPPPRTRNPAAKPR